MRVLFLWMLAACGDARTTNEAPARVATPVQTAPAATAPVEAANDEACAQVIVVAWQGAAHAAETITRSKEDARARAEALLARLDDTDFAMLARSDSDAAASGPRGGLIGTYARDEWPDAHGVLRDPVFALQVGQTSEVIEAPYGYAIARRCPVEKVHTRHILVRYAGARNAPADVIRSRDAAHILATELRSGVMLPGASFESVARQRSEDSSSERGGDLGSIGRGRMAPAYEAAAFALEPGQISEVVETEFGFHVIQRVE